MNRPVIVIGGVTGTGKSDLAHRLALALDGEIISADSVAVYREMNIGSAKPSLLDRQAVPYHCVDIQSYAQPYNVRDFQIHGRAAIQAIQARNKAVIIAGGTGLYTKALLHDFVFPQEQRVYDYSPYSEAELYEQLKQADPQQAAIIHPHNRKRVERALSVAKSQNQAKSQILANHEPKALYDYRLFVLQSEREILYQRINQRVERMIRDGLEAEVRSLGHFEYQSMQAIGYREFAPYFHQEISLAEVVAHIQQHTRTFAKRQLTWYRHQFERAEWIDIAALNSQQLIGEIKQWYEQN